MRRLHEHFVDGDEVSLGEALEDLQQLTERLRRDCPWDREQTERTIVPHTVEEAYEVADAAIARDDSKLADELGDLLFQVYFLALLLQEGGGDDLEAVARGIVLKLVRRHPHVFGTAVASAGLGASTSIPSARCARWHAAPADGGNERNAMPPRKESRSPSSSSQSRTATSTAPRRSSDERNRYRARARTSDPRLARYPD